MAITIKKSDTKGSFTIDFGTGETARCPANDYLLRKNGVKCYMISKHNNERLFDGVLPTEIINGDTGVAFASFTALDTYIATNFFSDATGDGGTTTDASELITGTLDDERLSDNVVKESDLTDIDDSVIEDSENAVQGGAVFAEIETLKGGFTGTLQDLYDLITSDLPTLEAPTLTFGTSTSSQNVVNWTASTNSTGYILEYYNGSAWVNLYTGALRTFTQTGLTASTSYDYRIRATASGYNTSSNGTGSKSTASAGLSIVPIVFSTRGAGVTFNSGTNTYGTTYPGSDGWNFPCAGSGKKLAAGSDGAVYLTCDGVNSEVILGFNVADSGNYYSIPVGIRFGSLAYPDLLMLDNDGYTYLEPLVNGTKYRLIRTSGVWKIQKSIDSWATSTDVATLNYAGSGDLYPVADMHTTSTTEGAMVNPSQSGLV